MRLHFIIFYTDRGLKDFGDGTYQAARAIGPLLLVRPKCRGDAGLITHEIQHVKQWAVVSLLVCVALASIGLIFGDLAGVPLWSLFPAGLGAHSMLYALLPEYRLWAEVDAYKAQAKHYSDDRLPKFAGFIAERYGLAIHEDAALALLRE